MRIITAISGASGAAYGLELIGRLKEAGHELHGVVSRYGYAVMDHECGVGKEALTPLVHALHDNDDMAACIASGSFRADAMVIAPCSMRTLAAVAAGLADNLMCRAADVIIKERKPLVLAVRETPLSAVHLENMLKLARLGVCVMPLAPGFYHRPETISDLLAMMAGRIMDNLGVPGADIPRWQGMAKE